MLTDKQHRMLQDAVDNDGVVVVLRKDNPTRNRLRDLGYLVFAYGAGANIGSACQCEITEAGRKALDGGRTHDR